MEIPVNDFLCNILIFGKDDYITKLRFLTKKGKELEVGTNDGEYKGIEYLNNSKAKAILYLFGGYRDKLKVFGYKFLPINYYLWPTIGFFELKIKLKNNEFKKNIENKINEFDNASQFVYKMCLLPNHIFYKIIQLYIIDNNIH